MLPVTLAGRYMDAAGVERDCMVRGTSVDDLEILSTAGPETTGRIVCHVPGLGILAGRPCRATATSFGLELEAGAPQRRRLSARLGWHRALGLDGPERREAGRVVPARADVVVTWGGVEFDAELRDVSTTGAAIDLMPRPPLECPVTVGRRRATVIRHTETGIGVRFILPLRPESVTEEIVL